AEEIVVGDSLIMNKIHCSGTVNLNLAHVGGDLTLRGAQLDGAGGDALTAGSAVIGGYVDATPEGGGGNKGPFRAQGKIMLEGAEVGALWMDEATLEVPDGEALLAVQITVRQTLAARAASVKGTISLEGATIGKLVDFSNAKLSRASADLPALLMRGS